MTADDRIDLEEQKRSWHGHPAMTAYIEAVEALDELTTIFPSAFGDEPELVRAKAATARFRFGWETQPHA